MPITKATLLLQTDLWERTIQNKAKQILHSNLLEEEIKSFEKDILL